MEIIPITLRLSRNTRESVTNFIGTYDCKADGKGRITIPSTLKSQLLPMIEGEFVIRKSVYHPCLDLYPRTEYDKLVAKLFESENLSHKDFDKFQRYFNAGTLPIRIEDNGRLLIPKNLKVFAGIDKDVVLSSAFDHIEIWDKERYEQVLNDSQAEFDQLAERLFARNHE